MQISCTFNLTVQLSTPRCSQMKGCRLQLSMAPPTAQYCQRHISPSLPSPAWPAPSPSAPTCLVAGFAIERALVVGAALVVEVALERVPFAGVALVVEVGGRTPVLVEVGGLGQLVLLLLLLQAVVVRAVVALDEVRGAHLARWTSCPSPEGTPVLAPGPSVPQTSLPCDRSPSSTSPLGHLTLPSPWGSPTGVPPIRRC